MPVTGIGGYINACIRGISKFPYRRIYHIGGFRYRVIYKCLHRGIYRCRYRGIYKCRWGFMNVEVNLQMTVGI